MLDKEQYGPLLLTTFMLLFSSLLGCECGVPAKVPLQSKEAYCIKPYPKNCNVDPVCINGNWQCGSCINGEVQECYTGKSTEINVGTCRKGKQTCANKQWGECIGQVLPTKEKCSPLGADENCDGVIDEGCDCDFEAVNKAGGRVCGIDVGECQTGTQMCSQDGKWLSCENNVGPTKEACNDKDDDCDGTIDNGYDDKNKPCTVGQGECRNTGVRVCTKDGKGTTCSVNPKPSSTERCNGKDDDCDGKIDNSFDRKGQPCTVGQGICRNSGTFVCTRDGKGVTCNAQPKAKTYEICDDGLDNNCDGQIDENAKDLGKTCDNGLKGDCYAEGKIVCSQDRRRTICDATPPTKPETCNGKDDDCDGNIDEDFPDKGKSCQVSNEDGVCADGVYECKNGMKECVSQTTPSQEICNNKDDDCDGDVDEDLKKECRKCNKKGDETCENGQWKCDIQCP